MRLIFKNVGHGDSIILEWIKEGERRIGIIDCKTWKGHNPIVTYLKNDNFSHIDFILLSHPHFDHFSGMKELLEYCDSKNIIIKKLLHTSFQTPDFLRSAVKGYKASYELALLFKKIRELWKDKNVIKYQSFVYNEIRSIELNDQVLLEVLAPTTVEFDNFTSKTYTGAEENSYSNSHGNWLSTVIKIEGHDWYILLTSDVELLTLKDIGYNREDKLNKNLILCQSPHHGSIKNHSNIFWRKRKRDKSKVVFSVGHNSYGHPSSKVIKKFKDYDYEIYSTSLVGGLVKDNVDSLEERKIQEKDMLLENLDIKDINDSTVTKFYGDKIFEINNGQASFII